MSSNIEAFIEAHTLHPHHRVVSLGTLRAASGIALVPPELFRDELLLTVSGFRADDDESIVVVFFEINLGVGFFAGSIRMNEGQWGQLIPTALVLRGAPNDASSLDDDTIRFVPAWPTRLRVQPRDASVLASRWRHGARPRMTTIALFDRVDDHSIEIDGFHAAYLTLTQVQTIEQEAANAIAQVLEKISAEIGTWDGWKFPLPELIDEMFEEDGDGLDF